MSMLDLIKTLLSLLILLVLLKIVPAFKNALSVLRIRKKEKNTKKVVADDKKVEE